MINIITIWSVDNFTFGGIPTTENGRYDIELGVSYQRDINHDVCVYYRVIELILVNIGMRWL
jgi:hypothetical protein